MQAGSCTVPARPARLSMMRAIRAFLPLWGMALLAAPLMAQPEQGGEASLDLPNLDSATFLGGIGGRGLLMFGLLFCALGASGRRAATEPRRRSPSQPAASGANVTRRSRPSGAACP